MGAPFQAVGGVAVAQLMRENRNAELAPGVHYGALHIGLVHPVTDYCSSNRVAAGVVSREEPGPSPAKLAFGILPGQTMRQHQGGAVLLVALPDHPSILHLLGQFREQRGRQWHHPIIAAFGPSDAEPASFQAYVLDAQIERLRHAQSAAVEQPCDQVGRVAALVPDGLK